MDSRQKNMKNEEKHEKNMKRMQNWIKRMATAMVLLKGKRNIKGGIATGGVATGTHEYP